MPKRITLFCKGKSGENPARSRRCVPDEFIAPPALPGKG